MHARTILAAILALAGCTGAIGGEWPRPAGGGPSNPPAGSGSPGAGRSLHSGRRSDHEQPRGALAAHRRRSPGTRPQQSGLQGHQPRAGADPPADAHRIRQHGAGPAGRGPGAGQDLPGRGAAAQLRQQRRAAVGLRRSRGELPQRRQGDWQARGGRARPFLPCDPAKDGGEAVCLDRFLDGFGRRIWRRPLEPGGEGRPEAGVHGRAARATLPRGSTRWCG